MISYRPTAGCQGTHKRPRSQCSRPTPKERNRSSVETQVRAEGEMKRGETTAHEQWMIPSEVRSRRTRAVGCEGSEVEQIGNVGRTDLPGACDERKRN